MPEQCENCGRIIGKIETPFVYNDNVVCSECWTRLKASESVGVIAAPPAEQLVVESSQFPPQSPIVIATHNAYHVPPRVQTIEKTGKHWKAQMLLAALLSIVGVVVFVVAVNAAGNDSGNGVMPRIAGLGCYAVFGGMCWFLIARIGAWWNHG